MLPSHARANGSLPIPCMSCLSHRCSVSLSNKIVRVGLAAVEPLSPPPFSLLLLFAGWGLCLFPLL